MKLFRFCVDGEPEAPHLYVMAETVEEAQAAATAYLVKEDENPFPSTAKLSSVHDAGVVIHD